MFMTSEQAFDHRAADIVLAEANVFRSGQGERCMNPRKGAALEHDANHKARAGAFAREDVD